MMTRTTCAATAAAVLLLTGCGSGSDESAHRAAAAAALGRESLTDSTWTEILDSARQTCEEEEGVFALTTTMSVSADGGLALRRVNVEHVCPERLEELDRLVSGLSD
ncbi:hypothetical protein SUDANB121_00171 [Nocardiopsis dassonvillei]|uniref:hypothetical protein n=1 Tax=Nocardiopsis dassonvillei TaxID=2014 RepID=UPI003F545BA0